jgi:muramoyltetrapeptide carboxypeptidase
MIRPARLQAGDSVGIVATGRKVSPDDIKHAVDILESWGLTIVAAPHLHSSEHAYLAASDEHRLHDLQHMIDDPQIRAVFCARGGYGTTRFIDKVDFSPLLTQPKWIAGFSDVTAIHLNLARLGVQSLHATMPLLFAQHNATRSINSLRNIIFGGSTEINVPPSTYNIKGRATGPVIGGNLSLVVDSLATRNEPPFEGAILMLEETDEHLYKLDRMMTHLHRAGKLQVLRGLLIGHITSPQETSLPFGETLADIVRRLAATYNYPVAFGMPFGHENPNLAWVHGASMTLSVDESGVVLHEENPT